MKVHTKEEIQTLENAYKILGEEIKELKDFIKHRQEKYKDNLNKPRDLDLYRELYNLQKQREEFKEVLVYNFKINTYDSFLEKVLKPYNKKIGIYNKEQLIEYKNSLHEEFGKTKLPSYMLED